MLSWTPCDGIAGRPLASVDHRLTPTALCHTLNKLTTHYELNQSISQSIDKSDVVSSEWHLTTIIPTQPGQCWELQSNIWRTAWKVFTLAESRLCPHGAFLCKLPNHVHNAQ